MSQLYFPKTRLQKLRCVATIVALTICGLAFIYLSIFLVKDKINRDKQSVVQERTQKWIVDTVYQKGDYFYTFAHNMELPNWGAKIEDSIKPKYSTKDTISFNK